MDMRLQRRPHLRGPRIDAKHILPLHGVNASAPCERLQPRTQDSDVNLISSFCKASSTKQKCNSPALFDQYKYRRQRQLLVIVQRHPLSYSTTEMKQHSMGSLQITNTYTEIIICYVQDLYYEYNKETSITFNLLASNPTFHRNFHGLLPQ